MDGLSVPQQDFQISTQSHKGINSIGKFCATTNDRIIYWYISTIKQYAVINEFTKKQN